MTAAKPVLTIRQHQVLELASHGLSDGEIALKLRLSVNSVKRHIKDAYRRLDIPRGVQGTSRARAVRVCFERRIFTVPDREAS
jgi:DNA-binding NarL/FixJ family response regulator